MAKVVCLICDVKTHAIQSHLKSDHGEGSATPMTLAEYREKFPKAPLLSEEAKRHLAAKATGKTAKASETKKSSEKTAPMHEAFELGAAKAALNARGKPIMIDMCQQEGDEDLIPDIDPNYVFNIDNLKTLLMALAMNIPAYLYGHAGVGKSSVWENICARTNRRLHRVQHTINTEESHIVGEKTVVKERCEKTGELISSIKFELGPLPTAMLKGHVYMADEYDRSLPSVLSVYQAVLEGKPLYIKEAPPEYRIIRPHPDFRFVATGNTNGAGDESRLYNSTMVQDAATFERFGVVIFQDYMPESSEVQIVRSQGGVSKTDASRIVDFARRIREQHPARISLSIGPRVLINIARVGLGKGCFLKGVEIAFANRLPSSERTAALETAKRLFS